MRPMADAAVARIQRAGVHGGLSGRETWDLIRQELIAAYTLGVQESAAIADAEAADYRDEIGATAVARDMSICYAIAERIRGLLPNQEPPHA